MERIPIWYIKLWNLKTWAKNSIGNIISLNNRLCGVILIGDVSAMAKMTQLLEKHATYQEVME